MLEDMRRDLPLDRAAQRPLGDIQIVPGLKTEPELRRRPEVASEAQCGVRRDGAAAEDDIVQTGTRDFECLGETII